MSLNYDALILMAILAITFILFVVDRWRYDLVAAATLLSLTCLGIIPFQEAFTGFSNPAVITVIAVLVISKGLQNSGILDYFSRKIAKSSLSFTLQLLILCITTAFLSAFVNNVGALAVMLPIVIKASSERKLSPSLYLMPIAFSSLLGGLITLIGTPPNIIISSFRQQVSDTPFFLFDFAFIGLPVSLIGILFLSIIGWRIIPLRRKASASSSLFDVGDYITEVIIPAGSKIIGKNFLSLQEIAGKNLSLLVRSSKDGKRKSTNKKTKFSSEDILVIIGPQETIKVLLDKTDLQIANNLDLLNQAHDAESHHLAEAVLLPDSSLVGRMPRAKTLRRYFEVALLALSRQGKKIKQRLSKIRLKPGDVLLLRGNEEDLHDMMRETNCLPLASRDIQVGLSSHSYYALSFFLISMTLVLFRIFPPQISLSIGALLMVGKSIVSIRSVYNHIDWSIVVLLGALLPVGHAIETTGAAEIIVSSMIKIGGSWGPEWILAFLLVSVMFLSDIVNNAAAAALAAPIALRVANSLETSPDPFLMAVAIGASCAFLTPIGHQSNALVMGPGGYQFKDYWRLGLPLEILIIVISIPGLLYFWPL